MKRDNFHTFTRCEEKIKLTLCLFALVLAQGFPHISDVDHLFRVIQAEEPLQILPVGLKSKLSLIKCAFRDYISELGA